jgi:hypothetical protein
MVKPHAGLPRRYPEGKYACPFSPPCRLWIEGGEPEDATCEILELSSEGVNIAISKGRAVRQGQHGRLLIGSPEGDHYELPVDVSWVEPEASFSVLGLSLPSPPDWRFAHR